MRIGFDSVNDDNNGVEETIASNKEQVEDATWQMEQFLVDFPTSKFEIVEATIGNYLTLGAIKYRCCLYSR